MFAIYYLSLMSFWIDFKSNFFPCICSPLANKINVSSEAVAQSSEPHKKHGAVGTLTHAITEI